MTSFGLWLFVCLWMGEPEVEGPSPASSAPAASPSAFVAAREIGVGTASLAVAVALVIVGTVELTRGARQAKECESTGACGSGGAFEDLPALKYASGGVTLGLTVPLVAVSAILFDIARKKRADAPRGPRRVAWNPRSILGSGGLRLDF